LPEFRFNAVVAALEGDMTVVEPAEQFELYPNQSICSFPYQLDDEYEELSACCLNNLGGSFLNAP
jgi:hypothetical protein